MLIQFVKLFLEDRYSGFIQDGLVHKVDIVLHRLFILADLLAKDSTSFNTLIFLANLQTLFGRVEVLFKIGLNLINDRIGL